MRFMKPAAAALAIGVAAAAFAPTADAGRRHHRHYHGHDAFIGGATGFAFGAMLGALAQPRYSYGYHDDYYAPEYYYQQPRYYYAPAPRIYYRQVPEYYGPCSLPGGSVSRPAWAMC
jgi:hypothetical protein